MKKDFKILTGVIIALILLVLGLSCYIIYDNNINNDIDNEKEEDNSILLTNEEAQLVSKELIGKYFQYYHFLGPYCGEFDTDDYISFGSYETQDFRDYYASETYNSISEIREYYESFMVEELIPNYLNNGVSYLEQDGKLYCQLSHKGCGDTYREDASMFTINSIDYDTITLDVMLSSETCGPLLNRREGKVEITKDLEGNWLISRYDVQISDLN